VERTDSLDRFQVFNSPEDFRLHPNSERHILRLTSSGELFVQSSRSPNGLFLGPKGQDPFWAIEIFRQDLFGSGAGVDMIVAPELPETSDPDTVPFTTAHYFPGTDTLRADHILTLPLQMVHYTDTMSLHTRITVAGQAPIGTPLLP